MKNSERSLFLLPHVVCLKSWILRFFGMGNGDIRLFICKKTFSKREVVNLVFRLALNSWWISEAFWKPASETQLAQGGTAELCLQNGNLNVLTVSSQCNIFWLWLLWYLFFIFKCVVWCVHQPSAGLWTVASKYLSTINASFSEEIECVCMFAEHSS